MKFIKPNKIGNAILIVGGVEHKITFSNRMERDATYCLSSAFNADNVLCRMDWTKTGLPPVLYLDDNDKINSRDDLTASSNLMRLLTECREDAKEEREEMRKSELRRDYCKEASAAYSNAYTEAMTFFDQLLDGSVEIDASSMESLAGLIRHTRSYDRLRRERFAEASQRWPSVWDSGEDEKDDHDEVIHNASTTED